MGPHTDRCTDGDKNWRREVDSSTPNFTPAVYRVTPVGRKPLKLPLSNLNIGVYALRAV